MGLMLSGLCGKSLYVLGISCHLLLKYKHLPCSPGWLPAPALSGSIPKCRVCRHASPCCRTAQHDSHYISPLKDTLQVQNPEPTAAWWGCYSSWVSNMHENVFKALTTKADWLSSSLTWTVCNGASSDPNFLGSSLTHLVVIYSLPVCLTWCLCGH